MSRIFNPIFRFIAVAASFCLLLAFLHFETIRATSTDPISVYGDDLPKRYLVRDQNTGALSFAFKKDVFGKFPVATYRFGGYDFQSVTGWFYLQITSREDTMTAAREAAKKSSSSSSNAARLSSVKHLSSQPAMSYKVSGSDNFFYAGYIEGTLGAQDGRMTFPQYSAGKTTYPACQTQWLQDHFAWLQQEYQKAENGQHSSTNAEYWNQMVRIWNQLDGIAAGYNKYSGANFTATDVYLVNMASDAMDFYCQEQTGIFEPSVNHITVVTKSSIPNSIRRDLEKDNKNNKVKSTTAKKQAPGHTPLSGGPLHCSALVKVTSDDLFLAHDTWSGFDAQFGYRTFKAYSLGPSDTVRTSTFSGRLDGSVSSVDDFYNNYGQNGPIAVFETTEVIFNLTLYKQSYPQLAAEFSRVMTANYIGNTPKQWSEYFATYNGGEYCNSYVALALGQFKAGQPLPDGLFYVAEQIPGLVHYEDMTWYLRANGYFPSFNIPYNNVTYQLSGNAAMYEKMGNFYSWEKYARPEIFRRNQSNVHDLASMMRMMRYNDWQNDEFSDIAPQWKTGCQGATNGVCQPTRTAMFTIASRGDLMPVYPTQAEMVAHYGSADVEMVAQGCFGATDSKIASAAFTHGGSRTSFITNGPTNDQQPVFDWSGACNNQVPTRAPAVLDYPWLMVTLANDE